MLPELLEHDHGQQAGTRPPSGHDMEWCWCLGYLLAITACEFLAHRLDHLPLTWPGFQRSRHVLAKFAQTISTTAFARGWRIDDHAFARQVFREGVALRALARERGHAGRS